MLQRDQLLPKDRISALRNNLNKEENWNDIWIKYQFEISIIQPEKKCEN